MNGIVQGVGFRPFVYKLAKHHHLAGFVANTSCGVEIEVEGSSEEVESFLRDLEHKAPPLAVLNQITSRVIAPISEKSFFIHTSSKEGEVATQISPDVAVCSECLSELFNPADRRFRYPFINCTNCGPRYTIIENIPYDRAATSMRHFTMCENCSAEYNDPDGRRFHAQPNCCPVCGPQVFLFSAEKKAKEEGWQAIQATADLLQAGRVLAIKGLGGFHLAVDAANDQAVATLRRRKGREEKPFAVMVDTLRTARRICNLQTEEIESLSAMQRPIVLANKRDGHGLSSAVAPNNDMFGIMLPYTPLHYLLMQLNLPALIMTSGNYSDEPICIENMEAFDRLGGIADIFLIHNRDIYIRNDDSIVIHSAGKLRSVRRSRGYAPQPLMVNHGGPPLLAVGGELKNTVCLLKKDQALLSQHIGDLKNLEAYDSFQKTIKHMKLIFETEPELLVHDLHPEYLSTRWVHEQTETPRLAVQHHHAHLASCLAENRIDEPAIGLIMDGTGFGGDGTIWGGEVLVGDYHDFVRCAHFETMPLPGGDAAIRSPWRTAVGYLFAAFGRQIPDLPFLKQHNCEPIIEMIEKKINTPLTSSCGRLFDAVAAMSSGRQTIRYEAQAAIEFMQAAHGRYGHSYPFDLSENDQMIKMPVKSIIRAVADDICVGESMAVISQKFHQTLIHLFTEVAVWTSRKFGIKTVVVSGGVFQNQLLFEGLVVSLKKAGFQVLTHQQVPTNDGCISLGQAMIGSRYLQKGADYHAGCMVKKIGEGR